MAAHGAQLDVSPQQLHTHLRVLSAERLLATGKPVADAALDSGSYDRSQFRRAQLDRR
jgi:methylphosphotriester-DNA--protein-cysteine methyltransferase